MGFHRRKAMPGARKTPAGSVLAFRFPLLESAKEQRGPSPFYPTHLPCSMILEAWYGTDRRPTLVDQP